MKSKILLKLKSLFSPFFITCTATLVAGVAVKLTAMASPAFADFWQSKIAAVPRAALAYLTNLLPFSLAEYIILCLPLIVAVFIRISGKKTDTWTKTFRYTLNLVSVAALIYAMFLINFSAGYHTTSLDKRLDLERSSVSKQELYDTAEKLIDGIDGCINDVDFIYDGSSVMPYDLKELNNKLNSAYNTVCKKYPFISDFYSSPKPVVLSEPWTYTHVAGVYTFFTGEANINVNFPDYTLPYTVAHEMAHQRGIAREEEANFVAFLVCMESDDSYIRYSAYASAFEYVGSSLYAADKDLYIQLYRQYTPADLKNEMRAYNAFFEKYRENTAATVAGAVNDAHLKMNDQKEGERSYGLVVDLLVAYYKK